MKKLQYLSRSFFSTVTISAAASLIFCSSSFASIPNQKVNFFPENKLNEKDNSDQINHITKEDFNLVADVASAAYAPMAEVNDESIQVNRRWDDSTVNANVNRSFGRVLINMYGGLARRAEVTRDGFALVLCHELGHAYGGAPYLRSWSELSAEGQADYHGSKDCLRKVFAQLPYKAPQEIDGTTLDLKTEYITQTCMKRFPLPDVNTEPTESTSTEQDICIRSLMAGQSLGNLLSIVNEDPEVQYETPDPFVTPKTLLSYPKTTQCRLDTYHNGALNLDRPICWFKPEVQEAPETPATEE